MQPFCRGVKRCLCNTAVLVAMVVFNAMLVYAQSTGNSTVSGTVLDPSGAVVGGAVVEMHNPVSGFDRKGTTDGEGKFSFPNVPFNPYHLTVTGKGFAAFAQDVEVHSVVPVTLTVNLQVTGSSETVTVEAAGGDLLENTSTFHTDVDRQLFDKMPLESASSSVSSLVTLSSPGISADSNGLFHGMGDHAENSFSVDGQPITDQQSKVFSNQIPLDSIASMEVISGAPPAEFGEKTSVVINVTTRSGQGMTSPRGSLTTSYGSFGTSNVSANLGYGGTNWGNFISVSGLNSGRFLDPPEFRVIHDKGNQGNLFDRVDFALSPADSIHINMGYTRSWFQNPNSYDNVLHTGQTDPSGNFLGPTDQRSQIKTFNVAPSWTRLINNHAVFTLGGFVRRDDYNYYPSGNLFNDLSPIQQESVAQARTLTNAGLRSDLSYVKGIHNIKIGTTYQQTFLNENNHLGIVDPLLNAPCMNSNGSPVAGFNDPSQCPPAELQPNAAFLPLLGCYDLTRPTPSANDNCSTKASTLFQFQGHTDVKQLALYVQDQITKGSWSFNVGLREDFYNGLTTHKEAQPRIGIAYKIKPSNTVLRVSYARVLETPFNENLIISSTGCNSAVLSPLLSCTPNASGALGPGFRNEFHAGFQQAFGKHLVFSGEYVWKYTHNGYDFSILGSTPIFFPVEWHNSKIPGFAGRISVPEFHGLSAQMVFSSVAARFFAPQIGGAGASPFAPSGVFRIDHDEKFNQTTHLQYQPFQRGPWVGFNWRYDSGMVAGAVPFAIDNMTPVDLTGFTADQQMQAGLFCGSQHPTLSSPLTTCAPSQYGSTLVRIPAPGTENDDHNPPRIAPRSLFDISVGHDNLFRGDKYKWSAEVTAINLTNKTSLYNFLSTFSGTHYVTPRAITAQVGFNF